MRWWGATRGVSVGIGVALAAACGGADGGGGPAAGGGAKSTAGAAGTALAGAAGARPNGGAAGSGRGGLGGGGAGGGALSGAGGIAGAASIAGASGSAGATGGAACPAACAKKLPETNPPGCAEALCEAGICVFRARDADGDGQRGSRCKPLDSPELIAVGTDCDDARADTYAGAWDGPAWEKRPNRCGDGVDQNCSGTDGDDVTPSGVSCVCTPGDVATCEEDSSGKPVAYPAGKLVGACRLGAKTCVTDALSGGGKWGPCDGAVGPQPEACNGVDDDCDGTTDIGAPGNDPWVYDRDGDGYSTPSFAPIASCGNPSIVPPECTAAFVAATCPGGTPATCCGKTAWKKKVLVSGEDCDEKSATIPGEACQAAGGSGMCSNTGQILCKSGKPECVLTVTTPSSEAGKGCNGLDDDCDGVVDEGTFLGRENVPFALCFEEVTFPATLVGGLATITSTTFRDCTTGGADRDLGGEPVSVFARAEAAIDESSPLRVGLRVVAVVREDGGDGTVGCGDTAVWPSNPANRRILRVLTTHSEGNETVAQYPGQLFSKLVAGTRDRKTFQLALPMLSVSDQVDPSGALQVNAFVADSVGADICDAGGMSCPSGTASAAFGTGAVAQPRFYVQLIPIPK